MLPVLGGAYVAVHGGAGTHDPKYEVEVKRALRLACKEGIQCLQGGSPSIQERPSTGRRNNNHLDVVEKVISVLEDNPDLNAGYGSNLTLDGTVECDAAIMDGRSSDFGSVGAISGVKNPIRLARSILDYTRKPDLLGRIPPLMLTSEGARSFAVTQSKQIQTIPSESLVSPRAREEWKKWKDRLEGSVQHGTMPDSMKDTVGAVVYHHEDGMAAGVSSGGILLKYPGRIGEAGVFGAGCWAQRFAKPALDMACSVSGAGEYIIRTMLARAVGESISARILEGLDVDPHEILRSVLVENFWGLCRSRGVLKPEAGILLLIVEEDDNVVARLWCAFTTPSMAIGYASLKSPKPKALILRQPNNIEILGDQEPPVYITAINL